MLKKLFFTFSLLGILISSLSAQDKLLTKAEIKTAKVYTSIEEANADPLNVFVLEFKGKAPSDLNALTKFKNLQKLTLARLNMETFPMQILQLSQLQDLTLSFNKIKDIPTGITGLKNLKNFDIRNNPLESFDAIFQISTLEYLNMFNTDMEDFPEAVCNLTNLTVLEMGNNSFNILPDKLGNLVNLTILILSDTEITSLPASVKNFKKLRILSINKTPIARNDIELQTIRKMLPTTNLEAIPKTDDELRNINNTK